MLLNDRSNTLSSAMNNEHQVRHRRTAPLYTPDILCIVERVPNPLQPVIIEVQLFQIHQRIKVFSLKLRYVVLSQAKLPELRKPRKPQLADGEQLRVNQFYFLSLVRFSVCSDD